MERPRNWKWLVHQPLSDAELETLRTCLRRKRPYGDDAWAKRFAKKVGSEQGLRPMGQPRRGENASESKAG